LRGVIMKIAGPELDWRGDKASRWSVAMVKAVAALCVGRLKQRPVGERRDRLTSETRLAARPGGGRVLSGQGTEHGERANVFDGEVSDGGVQKRVNCAK